MQRITIDRIDHLVLTVRDIDASGHFYADVLGMAVVTFGAGRKALQFGRQKINLHADGQALAPSAQHPVPGSADLCLVTMQPLAGGLRGRDPGRPCVAHRGQRADHFGLLP